LACCFFIGKILEAIMGSRRVVVTGMGMLTPLGADLTTSWNNIKEGKSGIDVISSFDAESFPTFIGGQVPAFAMDQYIPKKESRRMDMFIQYGMVAGMQAFEDSGLEVTPENANRIGLAIGAGIGGLNTIENTHNDLLKGGARKMSPFFVPGAIINMIAGNLSIKYGMRGPNLSIVTACTTGVHNIGHAARMIAYGDADAMLAGGAENATGNLGIGGFCAMKALSKRNDEPQKASRPWDKDRDGFVLSDGAGVMMVEELEHAKKRGAKIYAELVGFGMSGDAYHMTSPPADGYGAALSMENAIKDAKVNLSDIDYINAHGTSTPAGDKAEAQAVKSVFGEHAKNLMVSSTKSMTGHLLGAAGAVESIISVLALNDGVAPPTINLDNPDEGCDLDFVAHTAKEKSMTYTLCNSFGFGGTNGSVLFKKY
jgi:3-oxoacyl-[acyl-carrier-protein] synthase II